MKPAVFKLTRRELLTAGFAAGGALTLGCVCAALAGRSVRAQAAPAGAAELNAFVRIAADDSVTVVIKHVEFGQGVCTGLPTLVAEELDADWAQMRFAAAPADASRYNNLNWGPVQGTGGSSSMNNSWLQMRQAGAAARAMLVTAAAQAWGVPAAEITIARGVITHAASARSGRFGEFAARAAALPVPTEIGLKDPRGFVHIGHDRARLDQHQKTDGTALYTLDLRLPGMLTALILHPPRFGATVAAVDAAKALAIAGVQQVVTLPSGVAVVARDFWRAKLGRDALVVTWNESAAFDLGSTELAARYRELAARPGQSARRTGDAAAALATASKVIEAEYFVPFLAHAAMEPMNCVARVDGEGCELWYGAQSLTMDQRHVAQALGIEPQQVRINALFAGGSFGRRADTRSDYVVESALIARAVGGGIPVKLVWTREDDMRAGAYRPCYLHTIRAGLDADGRPIAWQQRIVGQSILAGTALAPPPDALDRTSHEGASDLPYAIANLDVQVHQPALPVPVLWWRAVGHTHTAFATEIMLDELAHAAGRDPLAFRLALLADDPRRRAVLERAAAEAGWDAPLPAGRGRGIAVHKSFKSHVAEVVEVTVADDGTFTVDRVVVAIDCGVAVNPDVVRAQMEGGVGYALSAALHGAITLDGGAVVEDNFDRYRVLRLSEMPAVEVHIVASTEAPTGVGEPGVPPLAPALSNALFAASGKRHRTLPLLGAA